MATVKEKVWLEEYLRCFNATEAARRAGYAWPNKTGPQKKQKFADEIKSELSERSATADEVLALLGDHARADIGDFMDIESMSFSLALKKAKDANKTHLIKKVKQRTTIRQKRDGDEEEEHWMEIELHDSQSALDKLARAHGIYKDGIDLTSGGKPINQGVSDEKFDRAVSSLADAIGEIVSGKGSGKQGAVDASEHTTVESSTDESG